MNFANRWDSNRLSDLLLATILALVASTALAFEATVAPTPEVTSFTISDDHVVTVKIEARQNRYYILWVSETPDQPGAPINLKVPETAGPDSIEFDPSWLETVPDWLQKRAFFRISNPRQDSPADHDRDGIDDIYEAARSERVRPDLPPDQWLNPFDYRDADRIPDGESRTHWDIYLDSENLTGSPRFDTGETTEDGAKNEDAPTNPDLSILLGVSVVNNAASDYTPDFDSSGNVRLDGGIALSDPTQAGFQYQGTYYYGIQDECDFILSMLPYEARYAIGCNGPGSVETVVVDSDEGFLSTSFLWFSVDPASGVPVPANGVSPSRYPEGYASWPVAFPGADWPLTPTSQPYFTDTRGTSVAESAAQRSLVFIDGSGDESPLPTATYALDVQSGSLFAFEQRPGGFDLFALEYRITLDLGSAAIVVELIPGSQLGQGWDGPEPPFATPLTLQFPDDAARLLSECSTLGDDPSATLYLDAALNPVEPRPYCRWSNEDDRTEFRTRRGFSPVAIDYATSNRIREIHASGRLKIGFIPDPLEIVPPWWDRDASPKLRSTPDGSPVGDPEQFAEDHARRLYVAPYGTNYTPEDGSYRVESSNAIALPFVENAPALTIFPSAPGGSKARLLTSTDDPAKDLRLPPRWTYLGSSATTVLGTAPSVGGTQDPVRFTEIFPAGLGVGFIEFYNNSSSETVDLSGYFLSDDPSDLDRFPISQSLQIAPRTYATVGFKESGFTPSSFATLYLTAPDGVTVVHAIQAATPPDGHSLARFEAVWTEFPSPSPGRANHIPAPGEVNHVILDWWSSAYFHKIDSNGIDRSSEFIALNEGDSIRLDGDGAVWRVDRVSDRGDHVYVDLLPLVQRLASDGNYNVEFELATPVSSPALPENDPLSQTAIPLLSPSDRVIPIDQDIASASAYPPHENPSLAIDQNPASKYLNFGSERSGFIVTPSSGQSTVRSFVITTGNDEPPRDPTSFALYGTDDPVSSPDNSTGTRENWTLIADGEFSLPLERLTPGRQVTVPNARTYSSYKMLFPTLRGSDAPLQFSEIQFFSAPGSAGQPILSPADQIVAIHSGQPESASPPAEGATLAIDNDPTTKYLNFGGSNAGLIITPALGVSTVQGFSITTANDFDGRDPAAWELLGSNDIITTTTHGTGLAETWTPIASGTVSLPAERLATAPVVSFANSTQFRSYKFIVRATKAPDDPITQFAEIQLYGTTPNLDANLHAANLQPLRHGDANITNDFGTFTVPPAGITVVDSSLLSDSPTIDGYVGLATGTRIGTLTLETTDGQQLALASKSGVIDRDGTFAWLLDGSGPDIPPNYPAGLRSSSDTTIEVSAALLTGHSFEFDLPSLALRNSTIRSTGEFPPGSSDAHDPAGSPLGYLRLIHPGRRLDLEKNHLEAATDLTITAGRVGISAGLHRAATGNLTITARDATISGGASLSAGGGLLLQGDHTGGASSLRLGFSGSAWDPQDDRDTGDLFAPENGATIRIDNFSNIAIGHSILNSRTVLVRALAKPPGFSAGSLAAAIEAQGFPYSDDPLSPWQTDTGFSHDGLDALRSGDVSDGTPTHFDLGISGNGWISFWWNASPGTGLASLSINGVPVLEATGTPGWQRVSRRVEGVSHNLRWTLDPGTFQIPGIDPALWIDEFAFESDSPGLSTGALPFSVLYGTQIFATGLARVYCNNKLLVRDHAFIQNGQTAALELTVEPGATLELTGPDAAVFANTHNYGHADFGTLLINGVPQDGSTRRPNFHLRPYFDEE